MSLKVVIWLYFMGELWRNAPHVREALTPAFNDVSFSEEVHVVNRLGLS